MRILVDTNTLLSALLFPRGTTAEAFDLLLQRHRLVLCTYVSTRRKPSWKGNSHLFQGINDIEEVFRGPIGKRSQINGERAGVFLSRFDIQAADALFKERF